MKNDKQKFSVISLLMKGDAPSQITAALPDIPYSTVLRWQREFEAARQSNTINEIVDVDSAVLDSVIAKIEEENTLDITGALGSFRKSVDKAQMLQEECQVTALAINERIKNRVLGADTVSELEVLTESLCKIQQAFFNKNTTSVNVQNNFDAAPAYNNFLTDEPT